MTANPYVADVAGVDWARGSTELSDVKGLYDDIVTEHNAVASVFDAGGFALDVLGDIGDPLGAVIGCAVGWIVEHVSFLREPVDWLAGDPDSINASVETWNNVSAGMRAAATTYADALGQLDSSWTGDAADAYRRKAAEWVDALNGAGTAAQLEGLLIAATGGLCAAFRGLIFDAISAALERWVMVGLVALANSAWTFGASIAGWVIDVEIDAALLAARISAKIAELVGKAGRIAQSLGSNGSKLAKIGDKLVALSDRMLHNVNVARGHLGYDRFLSRQDRDGRAVQDGLRLNRSVHRADDLLPLGTAGDVLEDTGNTVQVGSDVAQGNDPSQSLDDLVSGTVEQGAGKGTEKPAKALTDALSPHRRP